MSLQSCLCLNQNLSTVSNQKNFQIAPFLLPLPNTHFAKTSAPITRKDITAEAVQEAAL